MFSQQLFLSFRSFLPVKKPIETVLKIQVRYGNAVRKKRRRKERRGDRVTEEL